MTGPCVCHNCGETWPRHPALEVPCPTCQAPIGQACRKPSGHNRWSYEGPHVSREQAAVNAEIMSICAEGPTARGEAPKEDQPALFEVPA